MTSQDVSHALLRELKRIGGDATGPVGDAFRFTRDFDSSLSFPDLAFDPAAPAARYGVGERTGIGQIVDVAGGLLHDHAPAAFAFVDRQLERALLRRSDHAAGAASSSNRERVGVCVLTDLHLPSDRVFVCAEALVHESVHQYLYRVEVDEGPFCDLEAAGRHRSPWSGNRIPLHSLVHACFVYFALLGLWCRLAGRVSGEPAAVVRDRLARNLFGYHYLRPLIDSPAFPRDRVEPAILDAIHRIAEVAATTVLATDPGRPLAAALRACDDDAWLARLASGLERVVPDHAPTIAR